MAEWSIAAVLKTVVLRGTGGSNPSLSAKQIIDKRLMKISRFFYSYAFPQFHKPGGLCCFLKIWIA